jgi:hypothetical protein
MGVPREAPERRLRALRVPRLSDRPVLRLSDRRDLRLSDRRDPRLSDRRDPRLSDRQDPRLLDRQVPRLLDRQDLRLTDRQDLRLSAPPQIAAIQGAAPARAPHRLGAPAAPAQAQRAAVPLEAPVRPSAERRSSASVFPSTGSRSRPITNRHATTCGSSSTIPTRSSRRRRALGEALE